MNGKSKKSIKDILEMSPKQFQQWFEEQERLSNEEHFEDKALKQFVVEPEESGNDITISLSSFTLLFIILCAICAITVITGSKGLLNPYVASAIAILSAIGFILLAANAKKHDLKNNMKYK